MLSDLLGTVEKTPGTSNKTKKQLRKLENSKDTLDLPLNKRETEKVMKCCIFSSFTHSMINPEACYLSKNTLFFNQNSFQCFQIISNHQGCNFNNVLHIIIKFMSKASSNQGCVSQQHC